MSGREAKALQQIMNLYINARSVSSRDIRVLDITLIGLGYTETRRRIVIESVIQGNRDLIMHRAAQQEVSDAPS